MTDTIPGALGRPAELMLVEDNYGDILLTQEAFKACKINNRLHIARDGEEALRMLRKEPPYGDQVTPDLILLDLNLPDGSGLDLLKKLTDAHLQTPVIVMTAFDLHHARPENRLLAGWLNKPVNPVELLALVEKVMGPQLARSDGGAAST